jgi:hypothetical protein
MQNALVSALQTDAERMLSVRRDGFHSNPLRLKLLPELILAQLEAPTM